MPVTIFAEHQSVSTMNLLEVNSGKLEREFLRFPLKIYRNDPNWVRPLDDEIIQIFDPARNKLFRHGRAIRWILLNDRLETIGRVAAFVDQKVCVNYEQPTGGIGYFECIDDQEAAWMLFDAAREWLVEQGMEAMDGPVNFGERDKWWGLLVEGFYPPNFGMNYNPPYYQKFFESYGFQNYFNQLTYHRNVYDGDLDLHMKETAERIARNPKYRIEHIDKRNLDRYAGEFSHVYNRAWTRHGGVKEITKAHAAALLKSIKPILDERLVWFVYYEEEPVGFLVMIPEMNQVFRHVGPKLNLIGKLRFLWYFKVLKVCNKAVGTIFGIVEDHQRKGLEGAIVYAFRQMALSKSFPYKEIELNWIGDFNPAMMRISEMAGFKVRKTHVTYRYLFDRTKPFSRAKTVS